MRITKLIVIMLLGGILVPAACSSAPQTPSTAEIKAVNVYGNIMEDWRPSTVAVAAGGVVTWRNAGTTLHAVISGEGLFNQSLLLGESFNYTFTHNGTFTYHDDPYNLIGTIYVR